MKAKWGWLENVILKWQLPIVWRCHVSQSGTDIAREPLPLPCSCNLITTTQGGTDWLRGKDKHKQGTQQQQQQQSEQQRELLNVLRRRQPAEALFLVLHSLFPLCPLCCPTVYAILLNKCAKKCITFSKCQMSDKKPAKRGCAALYASHSAYTWQSLFFHSGCSALSPLSHSPLSLSLSLSFLY